MQPAEPLPRIDADPGMIEQVLMNLCVNARDAMPRGGLLTIRTSRVEYDADHPPGHSTGRTGVFVRLEVADTGCGMDQATLNRLFEPFFTTKPAGRGTGLGLATAYGIVQHHRGWIEAQSEVGRGTRFIVHLPAGGREFVAEEESPAPVLPRASGESILLVEDDANVRSVMKRTLEMAGYSVVEAQNGPDAIAKWQQQRDTIVVLVSDMVMPDGINGRELAMTLRRAKPSLAVVLCSGYNDALPETDAEGYALLRKPFDTVELLACVRLARTAR